MKHKALNALRWLIALVCPLAAACNILCLTGTWPRSAAGCGMAALLVCWAAVYLIKRNGAAEAQRDTPLARARGLITAVGAAVWVLTYGMTFFWRL